MAVYVDTSAMVKLVVEEPETPALERYLATASQRFSSALLRVELIRATRRQNPATLARAYAVIDQITIIELSSSTLARAGLIDPPEVRSLDAIHLAAALELADELEAFITYDTRMTHAGRAAGMNVEAPM